MLFGRTTEPELCRKTSIFARDVVMVMCSLVCFSHKNSSKTEQDGDQVYFFCPVSLVLSVMSCTNEYGKSLRDIFDYLTA